MRTNAEYVSYLSRAASVSPTVAQILINRGVKTPEQVSAFLGRGLTDLSDPMAMAGVAEAVEVIGGAARSGSPVLVHGDYDADGTTAAAIMCEALASAGIKAHCYIPDRFAEGYGFSPLAVERARELGAGLIITVDCGISSFDSARLARQKGIGLIITDHHEPDVKGGLPVLPEALAVINPKVSDPGAASLSGAGVAFKLAAALAARGVARMDPGDLLDLAALGTLADSVPLTGENRVIVREGLLRIASSRRPGVRALKAVAGVDGRPMRAELLAFTLLPRMNAAGRMAQARDVVDLLLSASEGRAGELASALDAWNSERQRTEEEVSAEAFAMAEKKGGGPAIVLASPGWHEGVIGIVASRVVERYNRPAFVLTVKGDEAKGSARSIPGFDVHGGLAGCRDILLSYGGHRQAAGLRLRTADLARFEERISEAVAREVRDFTPSLHIDAQVSLRDVNFNLVNEIEALGPFGSGNPAPLLGSRGLQAVEPRVVGNNHLKLRLKARSRVLDAIGFDMGGLCAAVEDSATVDAAFVATINEWEGGRTLQLNLKALRPGSGQAS